MNIFKAVIFDLDGTLLNTLDDLTDAINHALTRLDRPALEISSVRRFVGNGVPKLIERALYYTESGGKYIERGGQKPRLFDECLALFTEYYNVHNADKTRPYDGIADMLGELYRQGIKSAIVTNKYDAAAQALKIKFFGTVDVAVGASDSIRPKPAPDGVNIALGALGADKDSVLYVGDGEVDIQTARNCGLKVAAVTWGFRDREILEKLAPDLIVDRPSELLPLFKV